MASTPCKSLKRDGTPCRGSGFDQLAGYCIANAPAPSCPPPPACRHAPKTFSQSLVYSRELSYISRLTLQKIGQSGDFYRLPAGRIRLPFARCPCTKPAICAGAVNHPHHTKLRKSQFRKMSTSPSTSAHTCATFPSAARGLHSPRAAPRAAFASLPSAVMRPKLFHPISRELSSISRPSLGYVDTSKNWTKRRLLQVACGKNPTAIRPVPMHEARDLRRRR